MTLLKVKPVVKSNLSVFNDFDRIFDEFFNTANPAPAIRTAPQASSRPAVNVLETAEHFRLELAAPGLVKSDFQITVEKNVLTIEVHKEIKSVEGETYRRRGFLFNDFKRSFLLPETVNTAGIAAEYAQGVLAIALPKKEEAKEKPARAIEIA
ncbi:MAG: Hsp20/alpha crystallin family protein [Phaeodactylibacter sp.]|nr:Hsp20/alpha crystallin family protein [Phaeodactylibacter sp.]MCB9275032.1 Hsp20/alpha crystallin family protein [Lewinellaceae bacterium]